MRGAALLATLAIRIGAGAPAPTPGEKVLEFARSKVGQAIGDGRCTALLIAALEYAGAEPPDRSGAWGEPLDSLDEARPGDILRGSSGIPGW